MVARATTKRLLIAGSLLVVGVIVVLVMAVGDRERKGVAGAVDLASDTARFESSGEAGDTFALIASVLMDDARACVDERSDEHPRCVALSEGAAYAQTMAVAAATCTGPGVFEMRTRTLAYLRAIDGMGDAKPPVERIPTCT